MGWPSLGWAVLCIRVLRTILHPLMAKSNPQPLSHGQMSPGGRISQLRATGPGQRSPTPRAHSAQEEEAGWAGGAVERGHQLLAAAPGGREGVVWLGAVVRGE